MSLPRYALRFLVPLSLAVFLFLALPASASGQTSANSSTMTLSQLLQIADESLTKLESRLQERKQQVESLQSELLILKIQLDEALTLAEKSQADLMEISKKLESLTKRYEALSMQLEAYRVESEKQIKALELQLRFYKSAGAVALISLSASGVYILGDKLGWW